MESAPVPERLDTGSGGEGLEPFAALGDGEGINTDVEIFGRDLERELKKQAPGKVVAFRRDRRGGKKPLS